jgi:hypothetical protein
MGLDAVVYCDCYEKGRLRTPPPEGAMFDVAPDGLLVCDDDQMPFEAVLAFDQWQAFSACAHERGVLLHHRLGNISLVALLRSELQREPSYFPILLSKVLYSGTHCGDDLPIETMPALREELKLLAGFKCSTRKAADFMAHFGSQMSELAAAALSVGKPIVF